MITSLALAILLSPATKDEDLIKQTCTQIAQATQARDWKKLGTLCTPDFRQTTMGGQTVSLKQLTRGFDQAFSGYHDPKTTFKINSLKVKGMSATGNLSWTVKATIINNRGKHSFVSTDTETDTFKKVNGKWLESSVKELTGQTYLDGKLQAGGMQV